MCFWVLTDNNEKTFGVYDGLDVDWRQLLRKMIALWLETVLIGDKCNCVLLTIWSVPRDGSAHDQNFIFSAGIFNFSFFSPWNSVAGFVTAIYREFNITIIVIAIIFMRSYLKRYPPIPMLSLSYFKIWASFESSNGAAKATATKAASTINYWRNVWLVFEP